jgi:hypothetical protein
VPQAALGDEEMEAEDEDLGHAETYAEYMPPKCKFYMCITIYPGILDKYYGCCGQPTLFCYTCTCIQIRYQYLVIIYLKHWHSEQ